MTSREDMDGKEGSSLTLGHIRKRDEASTPSSNPIPLASEQQRGLWEAPILGGIEEPFPKRMKLGRPAVNDGLPPYETPVYAIMDVNGTNRVNGGPLPNPPAELEQKRQEVGELPHYMANPHQEPIDQQREGVRDAIPTSIPVVSASIPMLPPSSSSSSVSTRRRLSSLPTDTVTLSTPIPPGPPSHPSISPPSLSLLPPHTSQPLAIATSNQAPPVTLIAPNPAHRRPCSCKHSMCLKLYCDCFAAGLYCENCNCRGCHNNKKHETTRQEAMAAIKERNANAFRPKFGMVGAPSKQGLTPTSTLPIPVNHISSLSSVNNNTIASAIAKASAAMSANGGHNTSNGEITMEGMGLVRSQSPTSRLGSRKEGDEGSNGGHGGRNVGGSVVTVMGGVTVRESGFRGPISLTMTTRKRKNLFSGATEESPSPVVTLPAMSTTPGNHPLNHDTDSVSIAVEDQPHLAETKEITETRDNITFTNKIVNNIGTLSSTVEITPPSHSLVNPTPSTTPNLQLLPSAPITTISAATTPLPSSVPPSAVPSSLVTGVTSNTTASNTLIPNNTIPTAALVAHLTTKGMEIHSQVGYPSSSLTPAGVSIVPIHHRGCKCKKSHCRMRYCECFGAGVMCGDNCRCQDCMNTEKTADVDFISDKKRKKHNKKLELGVGNQVIQGSDSVSYTAVERTESLVTGGQGMSGKVTFVTAKEGSEHRGNQQREADAGLVHGDYIRREGVEEGEDEGEEDDEETVVTELENDSHSHGHGHGHGHGPYSISLKQPSTPTKSSYHINMTSSSFSTVATHSPQRSGLSTLHPSTNLGLSSKASYPSTHPRHPSKSSTSPGSPRPVPAGSPNSTTAPTSSSSSSSSSPYKGVSRSSQSSSPYTHSGCFNSGLSSRTSSVTFTSGGVSTKNISAVNPIATIANAGTGMKSTSMSLVPSYNIGTNEVDLSTIYPTIKTETQYPSHKPTVPHTSATTTMTTNTNTNTSSNTTIITTPPSSNTTSTSTSPPVASTLSSSLLSLSSPMRLVSYMPNITSPHRSPSTSKSLAYMQASDILRNVTPLSPRSSQSSLHHPTIKPEQVSSSSSSSPSLTSVTSTSPANRIPQFSTQSSSLLESVVMTARTLSLTSTPTKSSLSTSSSSSLSPG